MPTTTNIEVFVALAGLREDVIVRNACFNTSVDQRACHAEEQRYDELVGVQ